MAKTDLPSEKAAIRTQKREEQQLSEQQRKDNFQRDIRMTFSTPHGLNVLRWLKTECQFGEPILGVNPGTHEIDANRTLYQAMRLNLYIKIRKMLPFKILKEVEYDE